MVVLQTASISKNADSYNPTDGQSPSTNTAVDRSLYDAVNPGCQDELTESNGKTATAEESLVASLTDALTAMTFDQENMDVPDVNESYSLNSESEIFITERQTDILEDDDRLVGRLPRGRSDTSDSSLNTTDNESLEPLDSNDERNLDESVM